MIKNYIRNILVFGMALTGAAFLIGGIAGLVIEGSFYRSAERTEGELIELVPDEEGNPLYPRFSYVDHAGERQTVTSSTGQHPFPFDVNDPVPVLYDPRDPANAKINTFWQVWVFSTSIPLISGIMFLACGAGYWLLKRFGQK